MEEHYFQCPHCWENISLLLDPSVLHQELIEDCEVCCNPILIKVEFHNRTLRHFHAEGLGQ